MALEAPTDKEEDQNSPSYRSAIDRGCQVGPFPSVRLHLLLRRRRLPGGGRAQEKSQGPNLLLLLLLLLRDQTEKGKFRAKMRKKSAPFKSCQLSPPLSLNSTN